MKKQFDHGPGGLNEGRSRLQAEAARLVQMKAAATPPAAMHQAPVAPARGVQQLVPDWQVLPGGTRRQAGAHWITPSALEIANARAVASARARDPEVPRSRAEMFTPPQIAVARTYAELVEWRAGSGVKCGSVEQSFGGSDAGMFIDSFIDAGRELARLEAQIGTGIALSPRRRLDQSNAPRLITVRVAVDLVILQGKTISQVLKAHGWEPFGKLRREVRDAIRGALDRMAG